MMPSQTRIPTFKSEKEEAEWWDAHPEVVTALFLKAKREGKIKRLPVIRGATRSTTIRLPIADIESARQMAESRGLPYQTYLKGLLHQALERERKAGYVDAGERGRNRTYNLVIKSRAKGVTHRY